MFSLVTNARDAAIVSAWTASLVAALILWGCSPSGNPGSVAGPAAFAGEDRCVACHPAETQTWKGSHHDLAMQDADDQAVLGNFDNATFHYNGITSRFFKRDGTYFVRTDGPDGKLGDFPIKHTFGVEPLQQYLIELPGGRLQALSIAWDTKRKRWFHLYPNERIDYRDELHWTKPAQNWNHMCGECHATNYKKNFDAKSGTYTTTATRFDVGCQACHGPAARHLDWVKRVGEGAANAAPRSRKSDFDGDLAARESQIQIATCARCHSRRSTLSPDDRHGKPLMDTHLPALLTERLYFADGQIEDEVYVYGSFLQGKMHAKGVRCSDCHDPHSTKIRAPGNALCVSCHNATGPKASGHIDTSGLKRKDYDSPAHHFHKTGKPGSQCVDCHAPTRTYMIVDPRRDHSFRIPRPDVSLAIGTPNACTGCHGGKSAKWATDTVAKWYGPNRRQEPHYGVALDAGRHGKPGAVPGLVALADDAAQPAIVRATALELLGRYPGRSALATLQRALSDPDPMVRRAAVSGQERLSPAQRQAATLPRLDDPIRAVRIEAARLLAPSAAELPADRKASYARAIAEFVAAQMENADRPDAQLSLGNLHLARGETAQAETAYRKAIALDPHFIPAYVNLADLYRALRRDANAERVLHEGLRVVPDSSALHEALGLTLVRQGKKSAALAQFATAAKLAPDNARHAYIYAVALFDAGRQADALRQLKTIAGKQGDRDVLLTLAGFAREAGDTATATKALRTLAAINPDDPALTRAPGQ